MTGPPRWRQRPKDSPPPDGARPAQRHTGTEALRPPPSSVVAVQHHSRLVESALAERNVAFQYLVRSYLSQILYGCVNRDCTTPTCLTCTLRNPTRPFRAPTPLTARALAHYLASQQDAAAGLCPHELQVPVADMRKHGTGQWKLREDYDSAEASDTHDASRDHKSIGHRRQKRKDFKSLAQNVYDTAAVVVTYSRSLPAPETTFTALASSHTSNNVSPNNSTISTNALLASNTRLSSTSNRASEEGLVTSSSGQGPPNSHNDRSVSDSTSQKPSVSNHTVHKIRHRLHGDAPLAEPTPHEETQDPLYPPTSNWKKRTLFDRSVYSKRDSATTHPRSIKSIDPVVPLKQEQESVLVVAPHLTCDTMEHLKELLPQGFNERLPGSDRAHFGSRRDPALFVARSLFYSLSDPGTLLRSLRDTSNEAYMNSPLPHLNARRLACAFRDWKGPNSALIFDSLWQALEVLFVTPPEINKQKSPRLKAARRSSISKRTTEATSPSATERNTASSHRYQTDEEAAHIVMICIHALTSSIPVGWVETWCQLRKLRSWGVVLPVSFSGARSSSALSDPWLDIIDGFEYEPAMRLLDRLLRAIGARSAFACILSTIDQEAGGPEEHASISEYRLINLLVRHLVEIESIDAKERLRPPATHHSDPGWTVSATFMEWLRTIIIKKWDGKGTINKWTSVGTAIRFLNVLHTAREQLRLPQQIFYMPYITERLDIVDVSMEYMNSKEQPNHIHLLQFGHFFPPEYLIGIFRAINFTTMFDNYARSDRLTQLQREFLPFFGKGHHWIRLRDLMKVSMTDYLVLDISRHNALKETLDQLWGREHRVFLKPLKVRLGAAEGELGLDQGGVTFEFFRIILEEAFKASTGMFTIDAQTSMTWFQPASLEPLWKFEMLGRLLSLAVYNGITLPVNFPEALYFNLLAPSQPREHRIYPASVDFIRDGWPTLASSFDTLLSWEEGDVGDTIMRDYAFSFDAYGTRIDVDMQAFANRPGPRHKVWPAVDDHEDTATATRGPFGDYWGPGMKVPDLDSQGWRRPLSRTQTDQPVEIPLVTNSNRSSFVSDYIYWLTYKSVAPQLLAFRKGFSTCLKEKSLQLFTATTLKALVEGTQDIQVATLRAATHYENDYSAQHPTMVDFWEIVADYSMDERRKLLEFVTASERVPVTGFENMHFSIVRAGGDTEMLPTSSTCFGKLMLPQYQSKEKMKRKLDLAIQNSLGFGVV